MPGKHTPLFATTHWTSINLRDGALAPHSMKHLTASGSPSSIKSREAIITQLAGLRLNAKKPPAARQFRSTKYVVML